jgi:hypothetical protein
MGIKLRAGAAAAAVASLDDVTTRLVDVCLRLSLWEEAMVEGVTHGFGLEFYTLCYETAGVVMCFYSDDMIYMSRPYNFQSPFLVCGLD